MMTSIAILATIGWFINVAWALHKQKGKPRPVVFLSAIAAIAWWGICFPVAVAMILLGSVWLIICAMIFHDEH